MVRAKVHLDALRRRLVGGDHHDTGVVDQHIDNGRHLEHFGGCGSDRLLAGQVELERLDDGIGRCVGLDGVDDLCYIPRVS